MIIPLIRVPLATNRPHLSTSHFFFLFLFFSLPYLLPQPVRSAPSALPRPPLPAMASARLGLLLPPPWPARPPARRCPVSCPARATVGRRRRPASCPWVRDGEDGRIGRSGGPCSSPLLPPLPGRARAASGRDEDDEDRRRGSGRGRDDEDETRRNTDGFAPSVEI